MITCFKTKKLLIDASCHATYLWFFSDLNQKISKIDTYEKSCLYIEKR